MSDYLHLNVQPDDLRAMSSLALAHMGDAVYEILARGWLCTQGRATCGNLHKETVALVRAEAQAAAVEKLLPCLTEAERASTVAWETRQLEIMDWLTDDVDWITGQKHESACRVWAQ